MDVIIGIVFLLLPIILVVYLVYGVVALIRRNRSYRKRGLPPLSLNQKFEQDWKSSSLLTKILFWLFFVPVMVSFVLGFIKAFLEGWRGQ